MATTTTTTLDGAGTGVCFVCTGNSCRSLMAEALTNSLLRSQGIFAVSAGSAPATAINTTAVQVLAEIGVDAHATAACVPKTIDSIADTANLKYAVTVCSNAHESCPVFPKKGVEVIHREFDDPSKIAKGLPQEEQLAHYRRVRDEIKSFVELTLPTICGKN